MKLWKLPTAAVLVLLSMPQIIPSSHCPLSVQVCRSPVRRRKYFLHFIPSLVQVSFEFSFLATNLLFTKSQSLCFSLQHSFRYVNYYGTGWWLSPSLAIRLGSTNATAAAATTGSPVVNARFIRKISRLQLVCFFAV